MPKRKKTWREKLADDKDLPKVEKMSGSLREKFGRGTMLIPAPREVDAVMRTVKEGELLTIGEVRAALAKKHGATTACPMCTGIFAWIAAHAAEEAIAEGETTVTPYWRTLKSGGELNAKYPGGIAALRKRLVAEGHKVVARGKRYFVVDFEQSLKS